MNRRRRQEVRFTFLPSLNRPPAYHPSRPSHLVILSAAKDLRVPHVRLPSPNRPAQLSKNPISFSQVMMMAMAMNRPPKPGDHKGPPHRISATLAPTIRPSPLPPSGADSPPSHHLSSRYREALPTKSSNSPRQLSHNRLPGLRVDPR